MSCITSQPSTLLTDLLSSPEISQQVNDHIADAARHLLVPSPAQQAIADKQHGPLRSSRRASDSRGRAVSSSRDGTRAVQLSRGRGTEMLDANAEKARRRRLFGKPRRLSIDGPTRLIPPLWDEADERLVRSILACGPSAMSSTKSLTLSAHSLQDFGDWRGCHGEPGMHYCLLRYHTLLGFGRCVPEECGQAEMEETMSFVCDFASRGGNCRQLTNLIPLDFCVISQLLACPNQLPPDLNLKSSIGDILARVLQFTDSHAKHLKNSTAHDRLQEIQPYSSLMDAHITTLYAHTSTLYAHNSRLNDDDASSKRIYGIDASMSGQAFCNYNHQSTLAYTVGTLATDYDVQPLVSLLVYNPIVIGLLSILLVFPAAALLHATAPHVLRAPWIYYAKARARAGDLRYARRPLRSALKDWLLSMGDTCSKILQAFNPRETLLSFRKGAKAVETGPFPHLAGIRVLSMVWVITGHSFSSVIYGTLLQNPVPSLNLLPSFDFQIVTGGVYAVDSFFVLSGFVMGYFGHRMLDRELRDRLKPLPTLKDSEETDGTSNAHSDQEAQVKSDDTQKGQKKNSKKEQRRPTFADYALVWMRAALHRYLRLAPVCIFVVLVWTSFIPIVTTGPMWPALEDLIHNGVNGGSKHFAHSFASFGVHIRVNGV